MHIKSATTPWGMPAYRRLWFSTVIIALANQAERLATGWLVLMETDSVFMTAASFAIQKAPGSLVAPIAGDISDRVSRSRMLTITIFYKASIVGALAYLTWGGLDQVWIIFLIMVLSGIGQSFELPATQGLITDIVPPEMAMKAVALQSTGARAVGALGSLAGGLMITMYGIPATLCIGAVIFLIGAAAVATMPPYQSGQRVPRGINRRILIDAAEGIVVLMRLPIVRTLLLTAFVVEMFAFAYSSVMPSLARDVLQVDADGLGTLSLMSGFGAVIGVAALTALGTTERKGLLLIGITVVFGLMLMVFASSNIFLLSAILVMGVGAMAAAFDAMQWTLLQQHVPDDMRGRSIGGWMFVIGFGWMGQLALGAVAETVGVQWAIGGAGVLVILTGIAAYFTSPKLRGT